LVSLPLEVCEHALVDLVGVVVCLLLLGLDALQSGQDLRSGNKQKEEEKKNKSERKKSNPRVQGMVHSIPKTKTKQKSPPQGLLPCRHHLRFAFCAFFFCLFP
jgi:hypothetical protein